MIRDRICVDLKNALSLQVAFVSIRLLVKEFFLLQNMIKKKFRNRCNTKHLKSMLRVAIDGPSNDFDHILVVTIELW